MSEFDKKVECGKHGLSAATFVCQHLASGEKLGFNVGYDPEFLDDLYPDAWCNECEKMLESEGEWNEVSEKYADIKLLCSQCYEDLREKTGYQMRSLCIILFVTVLDIWRASRQRSRSFFSTN